MIAYKLAFLVLLPAHTLGLVQVSESASVEAEKVKTNKEQNGVSSK